MNARQLIEAEDPRSAIKGRWKPVAPTGHEQVAYTLRKLNLPFTHDERADAGGLVRCDEYSFVVGRTDDHWRTANSTTYGGHVTIWRPEGPDAGRRHVISVNAMDNQRRWAKVASAQSFDVSKLMQVLEYAIRIVLPRVQGQPYRQMERQGLAMTAKYIASLGGGVNDSLEANLLAAIMLEENIDSLEGERGGLFRPTPISFDNQWPRKPEWHPGHRSSRMSMNRNLRRRSFGYRDVYSMRDRGWPYVNRGFDSRMKKYQRALKRFGQVGPGGEGI